MTRISRRTLGRRAALAAGALAVGPAILRGQNLNEKLNVAVVAVGGRGGANLGAIGATENIVAICDVNAKALDAAGVKYSKARKFADFREMFDKAGKEFDAVAVSTCEHTHVYPTLLALNSGKHVYCEKPLAHNIWEVRQIRKAAARQKVATQMGIQIHATENYRQVVELVKSGMIGSVREAHVWVGRAWGLQSEEASKRNKDIVYVTERPKEGKAPPAYLNWDLWLGPAAERPFNDVYFPGPKWYRWWDFGSGTMSDLGSHWNDLPFWALDLDAPLAIEASGPPAHAEIAPASMSATYEYGQRGNMPPVKLTWHQGENKPEIWTKKGIPQWGSGCLFIGDGGMLLADYGKHLLLPEDKFADINRPALPGAPEGKNPSPSRRPARSIPRVKGHHEEWIAACKTGAVCSANFEYAAKLTEANHLGNVAYRLGKRIEWDAANLRASNAPEAEKFIKREYRKGWEIAEG